MLGFMGKIFNSEIVTGWTHVQISVSNLFDMKLRGGKRVYHTY